MSCSTNQALVLPHAIVSSVVSALTALLTSRCSSGRVGMLPCSLCLLVPSLLPWVLCGIKTLQHLQTNSCSCSKELAVDPSSWKLSGRLISVSVSSHRLFTSTGFCGADSLQTLWKQIFGKAIKICEDFIAVSQVTCWGIYFIQSLCEMPSFSSTSWNN